MTVNEAMAEVERVLATVELDARVRLEIDLYDAGIPLDAIERLSREERERMRVWRAAELQRVRGLLERDGEALQ